MIKYTSQPNEDLGIIAQKFGMPSWKYLYELNKEKIGDNPDLLKSGTELDIPEWDTTSGDEKIAAKGVSPFAYTGGVSYRYPWVPFSFTHKADDGKPIEQYNPSKNLKITIRKTNKELQEKTISSKDDLRFLIPDEQDINIGIEGMPFSINNVKHIHPDDLESRDSKRNDTNSENTDTDKNTLFKKLGFTSETKPEIEM